MGPLWPTSGPSLRFTAMASPLFRIHVQLTADERTWLLYSASRQHVSSSFVVRQLINKERTREETVERRRRTRGEASGSTPD